MASAFEATPNGGGGCGGIDVRMDEAGPSESGRTRIPALWARVACSLVRARQRVDGYSTAWSFVFVFFPLLIVYLVTATYDGMQSPDPLAAAFPAWQYAVHGNLNLDAFEGMLPWLVEGQHHVVSDRFPGVIFFGVLFYWIFTLGTEEPVIAPAALAGVTATATAVGLLHVVFRRLVPTSTALVAALLAGFGTATWTVSADSLWPHGINQLWLAGALLVLGMGVWSASGAFFALAIFTRPHTAFIAAVTGLYGSRVTRSFKPVVWIGIMSVAAVGAVVAYNVRMFGEFHLAAGYFRRPEAILPPSCILEYGENILGTLLSPDRGILVLSPFLILLLPGLARSWRVAPHWIRAAALSGVVYMLVHLGLTRFSGGNNFFSYRLPIEMLTLASPLLVLAWKEWTSRTVFRRRAFVGLSGLSVLIHALGAVYWVPTFDERSPWTNFKVFEAMEEGGVSVVLLALGIVSVTVFLMVRTGGKTAAARAWGNGV